MRTHAIIGFCIMLATLPISANGDEIHVPVDQATIQAAIDVAEDGDMVLVADGTYSGAGNRDLDFSGKAITVASLFGPDSCIVDCEGEASDNHRGFYFHSGEGRDSVVSGFTITNGYAYVGGAIYCENASPALVNNRIMNSTSVHEGGGISCRSSGSPLIQNNVIVNNLATAGMYYGSGGGVHCYEASPEIFNNIITNNTATYRGAGICIDAYSRAIVVGNTIQQNHATRGGGIAFQSGVHPKIINNVITHNVAEANPYFAGAGGGIYGYHAGSDALTINNNILYNTASDEGGGIHLRGDCTMTIVNTIVRNNAAPDGNEIYLEEYNSPSSMSVEYCDVLGGQGGISIAPGCTLNWGPGNFDADPAFISGPDGDYYLSQISSGQAVDSPCLNSGRELAECSCFQIPDGPTCMNGLSTRTDHLPDDGLVDVGFHYGSPSPIDTVSALLSCVPGSGTLPLTTMMTVTLENTSSCQTRTVSGRINISLANGSQIPSWRAGYTNISPLDSYSMNWYQNFPNLGSVSGDNIFVLIAEDVTPAPYNQPPYPPAGCNASNSCTVTGIAP